MGNRKNIYSPLRYPGGKGCIFPFISSLFYENGLIGVDYAEPYAGGAGLALRLLFEGYVGHVHINDIDPSIYSFWKTITTNADEFCKWLEQVPVDIKHWKHYRQIQMSPSGYSTYELAQSTFYLNRTNISGVIKGGAIGGLKQTGKYKIDARFNRIDLIDRINRIASLSDRIHVSNLDGIQFIKNIDKRKREIFIYLDPPYFCKGADMYMNFYKTKDHQTLARYVSKLKKRWLVSYDNQEFILNLYANERKINYRLSQCASNRVGDEILIFSDKIIFQNSIMALVSPMAV